MGIRRTWTLLPVNFREIKAMDVDYIPKTPPQRSNN